MRMCDCYGRRAGFASLPLSTGRLSCISHATHSGCFLMPGAGYCPAATPAAGFDGRTDRSSAPGVAVNPQEITAEQLFQARGRPAATRKRAGKAPKAVDAVVVGHHREDPRPFARRGDTRFA